MQVLENGKSELTPTDSYTAVAPAVAPNPVVTSHTKNVVLQPIKPDVPAKKDAKASEVGTAVAQPTALVRLPSTSCCARQCVSQLSVSDRTL